MNEEKRYQVDFKYCDRYTNGNWSSQSCQVFARSESEAEDKCIQLYGLGVDCKYKITSVREVWPMNDVNYVLLSGEIENEITLSGGTAEFLLSVAHYEQGEAEPLRESYLISVTDPATGPCVRHLHKGMSVRVVGCLRVSPTGDVVVRTNHIEIKAQ